MAYHRFLLIWFMATLFGSALTDWLMPLKASIGYTAFAGTFYLGVIVSWLAKESCLKNPSLPHLHILWLPLPLSFLFSQNSFSYLSLTAFLITAFWGYGLLHRGSLIHYKKTNLYLYALWISIAFQFDLLTQALPLEANYVQIIAVLFFTNLVVFAAKQISWGVFSTQFPKDLQNCKEIGIGGGAALLLVLPIAIAIGFLQLKPSPDWLALLLGGVGMFFAVAIPEELVFRGLMLSALKPAIGALPSLFLTSLHFGLTHLTHPQFGGWRFVIAASIAGLVYGFSYLRTGSIVVAALVHSGVNAVNIGFFSVHP